MQREPALTFLAAAAVAALTVVVHSAWLLAVAGLMAWPRTPAQTVRSLSCTPR